MRQIGEIIPEALAHIPKIELYNRDCLSAMKGMKDKEFDLAIVDPPYGINHSEIAGRQSGTQYGKSAAPKRKYTIKTWDKSIPGEEYFSELKRISKNQIIWGANYMVEYLDASMGWVVWDKDNGDNGFSDCELAYTSFDKGLRKFKWTWNGMIQQNMKDKEDRIHPTQKPSALYKWLLQNYAQPNHKILDTHLGSGSIAIACHDLGFDLTAFEIDEEYYNAALKRFNDHKKQLKLF